MKRLALIVALLSTACVTPRAGSDRVNFILDPSAPDPAASGCRVIEETTKIPMGMYQSSPTDERSQAVMRNHAVEIGANAIRVQALGTGRWYVKYYACPKP